MKNKKFIVWGHKYNGHTHGYIHSSYFKAAKKMGLDAYWFDDKDDVSNFDFKNSIFLTEDQSQNKIPLLKNATYILHHCKTEKYEKNNINYINLANYLKWCDDGISAYHKENLVEKVNEFCFWDNKTKTIYQPWATDLTPDEIEINDAKKTNFNIQNSNYIGISHENSKNISIFNDIHKKNQKNVLLFSKKTNLENKQLINESFLSFDIRGDWHIECGYLPCRVFKNISYGRITGTNSENVKEKFGDYVIYDSNLENLYSKLIEKEKTCEIHNIQDGMRFIKENHTYINRIENLFKFI